MTKKLILLHKWVEPRILTAQNLIENTLRRMVIYFKSRERNKIRKVKIDKENNMNRGLMRLNLLDFNKEPKNVYTEDGYRFRGFAYAGFRNRHLDKPEPRKI